MIESHPRQNPKGDGGGTRLGQEVSEATEFPVELLDYGGWNN